MTSSLSCISMPTSFTDTEGRTALFFLLLCLEEWFCVNGNLVAPPCVPLLFLSFARHLLLFFHSHKNNANANTKKRRLY